MTPIVPDKTSWKRSKAVIACQCVLIMASIVVGYLVLTNALRYDKRQEDFSAKYYLPAVQDYSAQHYRDAVPKLQANLRAFPDDYNANFEMGLVLLKLDRKQEARAYFVNAQNSFLSHHGRFSKWKRYDDAQHEITKIGRLLK